MKKTLIAILILSTIILYGCAETQAKSQDCTPSWNCVSWSNCINNTQTRTCTDVNNCGVETGRPTVTQMCTSPQTNASSTPKVTVKPAGEYYMNVGETINVEGQEVKLEKVGATSAIVSDGTTKDIINTGVTKNIGKANVKLINTFDPDAATLYINVP